MDKSLGCDCAQCLAIKCERANVKFRVCLRPIDCSDRAVNPVYYVKSILGDVFPCPNGEEFAHEFVKDELCLPIEDWTRYHALTHQLEIVPLVE